MQFVFGSVLKIKIPGLVFWILLMAVFFGCKPKYGHDAVVFIDDQNKASDEVYINYLKEQIENYPEGEGKYLKLAEIYSNNNNNEAALAILKEGEVENPDNIQILIGLATFYLNNNDIPKLAQSLKTIRSLDQENLDFLKLSAGYSLLLHDYTNAIFFANRAMLLNPLDDETMFLRGSALLINNDSISARQSFEEAYKHKKSYKNFSKVFDLAVALNELEIANKYLFDFEKQNTSFPLCYQKGVYYHEIGQIDTAIVLLENCLEKGVKEPKIYLELAKIALRKNETAMASEAIENFIALEPDASIAYVLKARIEEKSYNYQGAINLFQQAIQMDSTNRLAIEGLENLERKVAYLHLLKRKENIQRQVETLKPLGSKEIN